MALCVGEVGYIHDDGDGVPNYKDQCPGTPADAQVDETGCSAKLLVLHGVKFAFNSAKLSGSSSRILDRAVKAMNDHSGVSVRIMGHTDSVGSEEFNQRLSRRRAESVRDYLTEAHVSLALMSTKGLGESQPVASNRTSAGRQQNRRVEIVIENFPEAMEDLRQK